MAEPGESEMVCMVMCAVHEDHNWSLSPAEAAAIILRRRRWPECCGKPVGLLARLSHAEHE